MNIKIKPDFVDFGRKIAICFNVGAGMKKSILLADESDHSDVIDKLRYIANWLEKVCPPTKETK